MLDFLDKDKNPSADSNIACVAGRNDMVGRIFFIFAPPPPGKLPFQSDGDACLNI